MLIRNKKTGQIIDVPADQLSKYGIGQPTPAVQPTAQPKSFGGFASNIGQDIVTNLKGIAALPGVALNLIKNPSQIPQTAGSVVQGAIQDYVDLASRPVDTFYDKPVSSILNIAPFLSAGLKTVKRLGQAGKVADTAGDLGMAGRVTTKAGSALKSTADDLMLRALRPSKAQLTAFKKKTGVDLARFMADNGLTDDFVNKTANTIERLQTAFDDIAVRSGTVVSADDIERSFARIIGEMDRSPLSELKAKAQRLRQEVEGIKQAVGQGADVSDITAIRREADKLTRQFGQAPEVASLYQNIRDGLQDAVRSATSGQTVEGKNLKQLGEELSRYYEFDKIASAQSNMGRGTQPLGLTGLLSIGAGGGIGGIPGAAGGYLTTKLINSPKVTGMGSNLLRRAGTALENSRLPGMADRYARSIPQQALVGRNVNRQTGIPASPQEAFGGQTGDAAQPTLSPGGQWRWDPRANDWVPNQQQVQEQAQGGISQERLIQAIMKDPKNMSKYLDLYKTLAPEKQTKLTELDKKFKFAGIVTQKAMDLLDQGDIQTGIISNIGSKIEEFTGTQKPQTTTFKAQIALARTAIRNALLGANMSEQEINSLLDSTFDFRQPKSVLRARMRTLVDSMNTYMQEVAGSQGLPELPGLSFTGE